MIPPSGTAADHRKVHRLRAVTGRIHALLLEAQRSEFWVQATFVPDKNRSSGGHCYGNLVEVSDAGVQVAKVRAVIWAADLRKIERAFQEQGLSSAFQDSQEICALCSLRYHAVHGLSLQIFEVDPTAGESPVERNRRRILETLQKDGLLDVNKNRPLGALPLRIGLVTAVNSAAYADFTHTLLTSSFAFQIAFAPAVMQGPSAAASVVAAIQQLTDQRPDLICIIRGGGSPLDLAWLDEEAIARCVAQCPVPVWVGIGHEIDLGVLDFIAHASHKTPTAAAKVLVERARVLADRVDGDAERLRDVVQPPRSQRDRELVWRARFE